MERDFWDRQPKDTPLFPDIMWSRPENRLQAGKLLIIGGHAQSFAAVGEAYGYASTAGIGSLRVVLPDALQRTVSTIFPEAEFAPSSPSGSLSRQAIGAVLESSLWADGVLLAGDSGHNSETAVLLEQLLSKYTGRLTITKDALDYFTTAPLTLLNRPDTLIVASFAQLQKIASSARFSKAFTFDMDLLRLVDLLHEFSEHYHVQLMSKHLINLAVAAGQHVSTTPVEAETWRLKAAAYAATWWLQNPLKSYAAITSSVAAAFQATAAPG